MPTKKIETPNELYQIKVTLLYTKPPLWRRLLVPATLTLEQLHDVLQLAMGWEDCHLHAFRIGQKRFGIPTDDVPEVNDERDAPLFRVLKKVGAKAVYTYDFGDGWDHEILVEKKMLPEAGQAYPLCVDGKRHAPPEDCGGVPGYYNLLEAISDPLHPQYKESRDWLGDEFDPEAFSVDAVNRRLAPLTRRRRS
jgi:Plasmid pRiA4b ORF-3-like protein